MESQKKNTVQALIHSKTFITASSYVWTSREVYFLHYHLQMLVSQLLQNSFLWFHLFPFYHVTMEASKWYLYFPLKSNKRQTTLPYFSARAVLCTQPWHLPVEETLVYQSNLPPGCFCLAKQAPGRAQGTRNNNPTESCGEQVRGQCAEGKRSCVPAKLH